MLLHICRQTPFFPSPRKRLLNAISLAILLTGCQGIPPIESDASTDAGIEKTIAAKKHTAAELQKALFAKPEKQAPKVKEITDLWVRIQQGLDMDLDQPNPRIQAEFKWYKNNQSYFNSISSRAAPYLHFIVEEADERGLPLEIALMPVVESTYDPFAYSRAGASGLWQIMPGTGEHFGLEQNWWYDGRRDVIAATKMALDYMEGLYEMFGDWELALAAYNSGPGRVQNAVRKNKLKGKPTDFWNLNLPKETTAYVPKLIAIGKMIRTPEKYGVKLPPLPNKPVFETVDTKGQLDMAKASKLAGMSLNELYKLNPGMNRWSTPPEGPHYLAIPTDKADAFRAQLKKLPADKRVQWQRYTVKVGDNLGKIAKEYRTQVKLISEANKLDSSIIRIGQALLIPVPAKDAEAYSLTLKQRQLARQSRSVNGRQKQTYAVKSGDSFWNIAKKYKVEVNQLARWNNMSPRDTLRINQKLAIWVTSAKNTNQVVRRVKYKVRNGDNLSLIAQKFNIGVSKIKDWNTLDQKYIHPGQQLTLYVDVTQNYD